MRKYLKILFLSFIFIFSLNTTNSFSLDDIFKDSGPEIHYCQDDDECGIMEGIDELKNIDDLVTDQRFSEYSQNVVKYLLGFVYLVAVILIIYAGFNLMTGVGDEEKAKSSKTMIVMVITGILIIFLAGPITNFIIGILNDAAVTP